jgi:hypothetical protein
LLSRFERYDPVSQFEEFLLYEYMFPVCMFLNMFHHVREVFSYYFKCEDITCTTDVVIAVKITIE